MVQTDVLVVNHSRNGCEYRLPELPHFSVDGYCAYANTFYEFFGCYWHGCTFQLFLDFITTNGDTAAARYEQTMARLEQIPRAGYQVIFLWECEFDVAGKETPEMLAHATVCQSKMCTRDALYGFRNEAFLLYYKAREGETIQHVDVMSLYP
jgi:G:T-mismatch repair DNA endonuclease (very short patch repair protein)